MLARKTDLGKDVFGYKGSNKLSKIRRHLAICSWWWQTPLIALSFTYHNNLLIDSLTMLATLTFGGPIYMEFPKIRRLFRLNHTNRDYFFSSMFNLTHHGSVSYIILFESDANKLLYCPIFCWLWFCHTLLQILKKYWKKITVFISLNSIWRIHWKVGPYLLGYWYVVQFMQSDNE